MRIPGAQAILSRLILVVFGLCMALLVLEAALQIGAAFVAAKPSLEPSWSGGKWRMLCLGDSNTFGVWLERSQAYPKVFEQLWNAQTGNRNVDVMNLGFPGMNSSRLVTDFHRMLWALRPDVVTVMIGSNDWWTVAETAATSPNLTDRLALALWRFSRVYRLLYMVRRAFQTSHLEVTEGPTRGLDQGTGTARYGKYEFQLGWSMVPQEGVPASQLAVDRKTSQLAVDLKRNLDTLTAAAREFGATLILVTYPSSEGPYAFANEVMREAARATDVSLLDVAAAFGPACPEGKCPELFPDHHPTAAGHVWVARMLLQELKSLPK